MQLSLEQATELFWRPPVQRRGVGTERVFFCMLRTLLGALTFCCILSGEFFFCVSRVALKNFDQDFAAILFF